jgi:hypothetical protein
MLNGLNGFAFDDILLLEDVLGSFLDAFRLSSLAFNDTLRLYIDIIICSTESR